MQEKIKDDTISRQAALEAVSSEPLYRTGLERKYADEVVPAIYEKIKALQPAGPEIIRCKDCKWFRRWINTEIEFCDLTESTVFATDYCSRAERKENDRV